MTNSTPRWSRRSWTKLDKTERAKLRRNDKLNDVLYRMCDQMPEHGEPGEVRAKVVIIGRTYAAGLERHTGGDIQAVTTALVKTSGWLDPAISELRVLGKDDHFPTFERLNAIARTHKRMTDALGRLARNGNSLRSFVSKYLHFHAPVVPLYDQYAAACLRDWYPWRTVIAPVVPIGKIDGVYWQHCVRVANVVDEWTRLKLDKPPIGPPTARNIDSYALVCWDSA